MASNKESVDKYNEESASAGCVQDFFGPSLPPHYFMKCSSSGKDEKIYGPTLPVNFSKQEESDKITMSALGEKREIFIGPELSEHLKATSTMLEEERETPEVGDDSFGPSTTLMATGDAACYCKFLSPQSQNTRCTSEPIIERETWMTELPEKQKSNFGFLPRHFKSRTQTEKESDSSVWTDTPADKKRRAKDSKKDHKEILKKKRLQERDKEMEELADKAWKKLRKKESLLEIHMKNMKRKKKKDTGKLGEAVPERRPFDRNIDLQIRKVDENRKRAILNKSQFLKERFASGASKFL